MKETPFEVKGPIFSSRHGLIVILREKDGQRTLFMQIDPTVAIAMGYLLSGNESLTHRLMLDTLEEFGFTLQKIGITRIVANSYCRATLYFVDLCGIVREIDSGPNDAMCLALTKKCPMFVNDDFLHTDNELSAILENLSAKKPAGQRGMMTDEQALDYLRNIDPDQIPKA